LQDVENKFSHCLTTNCSPRNSLGSLGRSGTSSTARQGWPTQSSGSTWPGYQVGRPLIHSEARMAHKISGSTFQGYKVGRPLIHSEARIAHTKLRINMVRILIRKEGHSPTAGPGYQVGRPLIKRRLGCPTQSSGSTWPGCQIGRPLINGETRMARPPGYHVERPLINSGTRMAHKDL
jgi:hypothetical protein